MLINVVAKHLRINMLIVMLLSIYIIFENNFKMESQTVINFNIDFLEIFKIQYSHGNNN